MDDLDSEFGASPLGKAAGRGGADVAAVDELPGGLQTASGAAPLPDIYGDLYGDTGEGNLLLKTQVAQLTNQCRQQEHLIQQLQEQLETLTNETTQLQELKTTLTNNISSLFNTAKLEIQRKDDEIKELRTKIASGSGGVGGGRSGGGRSSSRPSDQPQSGHIGRDHSREDRPRSGSEGRERGRSSGGGGGGGGHAR